MADPVSSVEKEYYALLDLVNKFDDRAIIVKGWSVTLSLAALGAGFQFEHYGLFLVACASGLGFWIIDALMKRHQMRYYARMREIEVFAPTDLAGFTTPQVDWSWEQAPGYFSGALPRRPEWYSEDPHALSYRWSWVFGHVALPHVVSVFAGVVFFALALQGVFGDMVW